MRRTHITRKSASLDIRTLCGREVLPVIYTPEWYRRPVTYGPGVNPESGRNCCAQCLAMWRKANPSR